MKLLRAEFENFRLLRDLELNFSTDSNRNLTVIRAANESGKTTILHGLQWALYGDNALPGGGDEFRLHPIDWKESDGPRAAIRVTVEFELTTYRRRAGIVKEDRKRYRLVRSVYEDVDSDSRRPRPSVKLFLLTDIGASPIEAPDALINDELPAELREVFFTDGDRALSFIEADVALSTKRERVQRAIQSLLGLGVIDAAIKHVRKSAAEANRKAKKVSSDSKLSNIATRLEAIETDVSNLEIDVADARQQFAAFDEKVSEIDQKIDSALQKGDKEKLQNDLEGTRLEIRRLDKQLEAANREHSGLFRSQALAVDLLGDVIKRASSRLEELRDQGKIPNTTIPVLEERLSSEVCICGEGLSPGPPDNNRRRSHIERLIQESRRADEIQGTITELYFGSKQLRTDDENGEEPWLKKYQMVVERRDGLNTIRETAGRKLKALDDEIDSLEDTDIQGLREIRRQYKDQRDRCLSKRSSAETKLGGLKREREELEVARDRMLREKKKGVRILSELEVTQDVTRILQGAYDRITTEELNKVSDLMNSIFLEMIGADPEQGAIIRRAVISQDFDIIVYGPNERKLNPDRDLNGASRRALTLAFILALTKVSEVEAPNVIDTPLGMTSGFVKRTILRTAIRESSQLILFLTHDEISGCEEIIDQNAGAVFTLTNPAHYPRMLVNNPDVEERKVLRCECNHRQVCDLCVRRSESDAEVEIAF